MKARTFAALVVLGCGLYWVATSFGQMQEINRSSSGGTGTDLPTAALGALTNDGADNLGWFDLSTFSPTIDTNSIIDASTNAAQANATATFAPLANPTFTGTINGDSMNLSGTLAVDAIASRLEEGPVEMQIVGDTTNIVNSPVTSMIYKVFTNDVVGTGRIPLESELEPLAPKASPEFTGTGTTSGNLGALLSVGDLAFVDVTKASQTNNVTDAVTFTHATNGVGGVDLTHVRWFFNSSGSDRALTIPAGWRTNVFSAVPTALTNATITKMYLTCGGPTPDEASQTNCYVSFEYYK